MGLEISIFTWWYGRLVGNDDYGNKYYQDKKKRRDGKIRRWAIYKGQPEASKIPCEWHGWLHYTTDLPPVPLPKHPWQKPHLRNLSGTVFAYAPQKNSTDSDDCKKNYEPWTPEGYTQPD